MIYSYWRTHSFLSFESLALAITFCTWSASCSALRRIATKKRTELKSIQNVYHRYSVHKAVAYSLPSYTACRSCNRKHSATCMLHTNLRNSLPSLSVKLSQQTLLQQGMKYLLHTTVCIPAEV